MESLYIGTITIHFHFLSRKTSRGEKATSAAVFTSVPSLKVLNSLLGFENLMTKWHLTLIFCFLFLRGKKKKGNSGFWRKSVCALPGHKHGLAMESGAERGRGLVSWQCIFPMERVRYIYFCRALYFSLCRHFNRSPICLLKHLPCESFRKLKSWSVAIPGIDVQTLSPPSLPLVLAAASHWPLVPARFPPAPGGSGLGAPGPLAPLTSCSWFASGSEGRAGEIGSAGNVVCLLSHNYLQQINESSSL